MRNEFPNNPAEKIVPVAKFLLHSARRGVLAVNGDNGYPYAIPVNYLYDEAQQKIFFHGAKVGHKVDVLKADDRVCFTVFGNETIKDAEWAPYLQSVVVFGRCHIIETQEERIRLVKPFATKLLPE